MLLSVSSIISCDHSTVKCCRQLHCAGLTAGCLFCMAAVALLADNTSLQDSTPGRASTRPATAACFAYRLPAMSVLLLSCSSAGHHLYLKGLTPVFDLYVCLVCCPTRATHPSGYRLHTLFKDSRGSQVSQGAGGVARATKQQHKEQASLGRQVSSATRAGLRCAAAAAAALAGSCYQEQASVVWEAVVPFAPV